MIAVRQLLGARRPVAAFGLMLDKMFLLAARPNHRQSADRSAHSKEEPHFAGQARRRMRRGRGLFLFPRRARRGTVGELTDVGCALVGCFGAFSLSAAPALGVALLW